MFYTVKPATSSTPAQSVTSNHFRLEIEKGISIYHYMVTMAPKADDGREVESMNDPELQLLNRDEDGLEHGSPENNLGHDSEDDLDINPEIEKVESKGCSRAIKKMVISKLLDRCSKLRDKSKQFATEFVETLVPWKELFPEFGQPRDRAWKGTVALRPESDKDRKLLMLFAKQAKSKQYAYFKRNADMTHGLVSGCVTYRKDLGKA